WGQAARFESAAKRIVLQFHGQLAEFTPKLAQMEGTLTFCHQLKLPSEEVLPLGEGQFFDGFPTLALVRETFYLLRNPPPSSLLNAWIAKPFLPVTKL